MRKKDNRLFYYLLTCNLLTCNLLTCNLLTCNLLTCNFIMILPRFYINSTVLKKFKIRCFLAYFTCKIDSETVKKMFDCIAILKLPIDKKSILLYDDVILSLRGLK